MNISDWPASRVMQLPDWCFGRRFFVCCGAEPGIAAQIFDISEMALPERCVIWNMSAWTSGMGVGGIVLYLKLGDYVPAVLADFDALEYLFPNFGAFFGGRWEFAIDIGRRIDLPNMRHVVFAGGKRLVVRIQSVSDQPSVVVVVLCVSAFPTEVPDWLVSG